MIVIKRVEPLVAAKDGRTKAPDVPAVKLRAISGGAENQMDIVVKKNGRWTMRDGRFYYMVGKTLFCSDGKSWKNVRDEGVARTLISDREFGSPGIGY